MSGFVRLVDRIGPVPPGALVTLGVVLMAEHYRGPQLAGEGLDGEYNLPALFSTAVLLWAAGSTWVLAGCHGPRSPGRRLLALLALLIGFFAVDELLAIHEALESLTGVDWQLLYLPFGLIGAGTGLGVLLLYRRRPALVVLYVVGAAAWAVAQLFEAIQWHGDELVQPALIYPEELLEVRGSGLFAVAAVLALRLRVSQLDDAARRERSTSQGPG